MHDRLLTLRRALVLGDIVSFGTALLLAGSVRYGSAPFARLSELVPHLSWVLLGYLVLFVSAMAAAGLYRLRARWSVKVEAIDAVHVIGFLVLLTLSALFLFKLEDMSRIFLFLFFSTLLGGVVLLRICIRRVALRRRASGRGARRVLIVGEGGEARRFAAQVSSRLDHGFHIVGYVNDHALAWEGGPWLGALDSLHDVLTQCVIHEVAVCMPLDRMAVIDAVADICQEHGKDVRIPVQLAGRTLARGRLESVEGLAVISVTHNPSQVGASLVKRAFDLIVASLLVVLASPLLVGAAVAIYAFDGRPILFKQRRGGYHGEPFNVLKFRTMVVDAEGQLKRLRKQNERTGPVFKLGSDPRVTPVGRFLRRNSIDELPQLFNVVRGEMSLVGPRPAILAEIDEYDIWHRRRLSVKPGITGLWQVTARTKPEFDDWVRLDLEYIDTWSMWGDLKLLAKTPSAVLKQTGE